MSDLATSVMTARRAASLQSAQFSIMKQEHEMQMSLIAMLAKAAKAAPAPGTGLQVDKTA